MDKKKLILNFIKKQTIGVIATVGKDSKPEAAVIEFGETDNLELIFDAYHASRKCLNIRHNNNVAFVIGWDEDITVQYEGQAFELEGEERERYKKMYFKKNKRAQRWETVQGIIYFKIVPKWLRYSDLNKDPWEIFEINL
ncbi:pyridoxamine 5'-phosphate oxidase family protein [Candidatus Microgenomates bacterium]|nr:pyridoxamine 5'-phosphate oxidase family protein [Candidatus Microgenomates bacterium]